MKEFFKDLLSVARDVGSIVWSPKVVFIRYFVVTPILILIIWLIVR